MRAIALEKHYTVWATVAHLANQMRGEPLIPVSRTTRSERASLAPFLRRCGLLREMLRNADL